MKQRAPSSSPKYLWLAILISYLAFVVAGTLDPWPTATAKLAAVGTGPHVPLTYSSVTSDTRSYRSQIYIVTSRIGSSWSIYRVSEVNAVAHVEEVRWGLLYVALFTMVLALGAAWFLRRSSIHPRAEEAEA